MMEQRTRHRTEWIVGLDVASTEAESVLCLAPLHDVELLPCSASHAAVIPLQEILFPKRDSV